MKANTSPDQFQLIPEEMMPFNLAGETLPALPQEIILCDENHCFCDTLDEYGDSVCKHDATQTIRPTELVHQSMIQPLTETTAAL